MSLSMSNAALQQAQAEKLTLLVAESKTGYYGVVLNPGRPNPYRAQAWRGGNLKVTEFIRDAKPRTLSPRIPLLKP